MQQSSVKPKLRSANIRRLLALVRPHWRLFSLGLIALAVGSGINLLFPEIIRRLLESGPQELAVKTRSAAALLILIFALQGFAFYFRSYFFGVVGQRVVAVIRAQLYNILIHEPVEFFDRMRAADLVSRINSDSLLLQDAVSIRLSVFIRYSVQVVVGIILMSYISLTLTFSILVVVPLLVGLSLVLGKRLRNISKAQQTQLGIAASVAHETFDGVRLVKAFNKEDFEAERFGAANSAILDLGLQRSAMAAFFASFVSFLLNAAIVCVLFYGVHLVGVNELALGDLTAFLLYGVIVAVSFAFLAGGYTEVIQSLGAAERIFELLDLPHPGKAAAAGGSVSEPARGQVEFSKVSFAYPSRPESPVLNSVSFTIPSGKVTAIVGPSGAGKSTLVNLLLALYAPSQGHISFDGVDLSELNARALREKIALVPQEQALFATSIAENLRYGKQDATLEELRSACKKTNMLEFIEGLPDQFNTPVGERGVQLSTGQKQRLAIARALLRNPALLILDEATSALDSENEHLIQEALGAALKGRTALVIAHRLSTIKNADKVVVLDRGSIVQEGRHELLSLQPGLYRQLVERQELIADVASAKQA
ncbi:MAG: ATP-binding cassette domain-containing protein [Deltaproteobacteria bacterium]|nr:ATP-binding cassette domain-containing protein [Deltaproteobacteria bacterium]